jgi:hypothetical protein
VVQKLDHIYITLFLIGIVAGAVAIAVSLVQRTFFGGIFIPELASQTLFSLTPGEIESQAVETLGPIAKYSAFIGALIVNLAVYGLLGIFIHKLQEKVYSSTSYLTKAAISSVISYVVIFIVVFILLTLADIEIQSLSIQSIITFLILPHIAFGFTLAYFYRSIKGRRPSILGPKEVGTPLPRSSSSTPANTTSTSMPEIDYKKRLLLKAGIASVAVIPLMYIGLNNILFPRESAQSPLPLESELKSKPRPVGFEDPRL